MHGVHLPGQCLLDASDRRVPYIITRASEGCPRGHVHTHAGRTARSTEEVIRTLLEKRRHHRQDVHDPTGRHRVEHCGHLHLHRVERSTFLLVWQRLRYPQRAVRLMELWHQRQQGLSSCI